MAEQNKLHDIQYFPEQNLLHVRVWGIFDADTHELYKKDLSDAVRGSKSQKVNVLADLSQASTQTKEVSQDSGYMIELGPYVRKAAIIVVSAIYKMQLQRSKGGTKMQYFDDIDKARAWLKADFKQTASLNP